MTDWKALAHARGLAISDEDMERVAGPLSALEAHWRTIARDLPHETEPATIMICPPSRVDR